LLHSNGVGVLECDQAEAIEVKARVAGRWRSSSRIEYLPIDLNDRSWSNLALWLPAHAAGTLLVMSEGVSPYIDDSAFTRFLEFLGASLTPGSIVAYDFKFCGANDAWGRSDAARTPFRLSTVRADVESFHETRGFQIESFESSSDLSQRVLNGSPLASVFAEDGLIRLRVARRT
jgi:O-methyltransferase involved in polyketide biosynthesis